MNVILMETMKKQFNRALSILKQQKNINGCIAGSALLGYNKTWKNQDIDFFCYDQQSFTALLYFMHYNPMFQLLDNMETYKFNDYLRNNKSSLETIGLVSIKFYFNTCIPINIIYKKYNRSIFDVLSTFDIDLISQGYCLTTGKYISLRESTGIKCFYNSWNTSFYSSNIWSVKRLLRQFQRVVKYSERGYDLSSVTNKYIELVQDIISKDNVYKTEKGIKFHEDTIEQFQLVLKVLKAWKKTKKISKEELLLLNTLI